jgi:hypothetical protein
MAVGGPPGTDLRRAGDACFYAARRIHLGAMRFSIRSRLAGRLLAPLSLAAVACLTLVGPNKPASSASFGSGPNEDSSLWSGLL